MSDKTITAYRIFNSAFASSWNDGEGAFRYGGRWNSPGRRVLYTSESLSLATLEIFVHLDEDIITTDYSYAEVTFSEDLVVPLENFAKLPEGWRDLPVRDDVRKIGDDWIASGASAVLEVPTAILPKGSNYIISLEHLDAESIGFGIAERFVFDERLR